MSGSEEGKAHELVIIRRRGHDEEGGHHGGVWKIAYADFMTAMMAFFLVMWLINSTDKKTLTQVATYFNPMRLTDKKPSTKGLEEPSGGEGKDNAVKKAPAKKDEAKAKSKKKADETPPGEVRSRGQAFQSGVEDQDQKQSGESGATSGDSRQSGGRAYRDPFDAINRSEITPNEPTNGRISRTPLASAPPVLGREASVETKPAAPKQPPAAATPPAASAREASVETKSAAPRQPPAAATPPAAPTREASVETKPAAPRQPLAAATPLTPPAREAPVEVKPADPRAGACVAAASGGTRARRPRRGEVGPPNRSQRGGRTARGRHQAEGSHRPRRCRATGGCHQAGGCRGRAGLATQHRGGRHAGRRADQPDRRLRVRHVRHRVRRSAAGHDRRHGQDREAAPDPHRSRWSSAVIPTAGPTARQPTTTGACRRRARTWPTSCWRAAVSTRSGSSASRATPIAASGCSRIRRPRRTAASKSCCGSRRHASPASSAPRFCPRHAARGRRCALPGKSAGALRAHAHFAGDSGRDRARRQRGLSLLQDFADADHPAVRQGSGRSVEGPAQRARSRRPGAERRRPAHPGAARCPGHGVGSEARQRCPGIRP